ncbi:Lipid phosphate phosphatase gamma [Hibiscus syriacus]|uniref:Lipid phosphate phosphatase gamma n=1 Tax=Hibiscus syriacus TaxID=106335 RepID=A0A6A3AEN1_HIBSY|nr:Lipid phosphate phosphatase gamma [Hibiscus syriacus]
MTAYNALKAVGLTHVRYQRGDQLGHFLAWVSLVPVFISLGGFVSHFILDRELQIMFFALGLVISQFINELIKKSVQQARSETCALLEMCDSHDWPSSHSQYMFFFTVYFTLLTCKGIDGIWNVALVFAGASLGIFLGGVWFWLVNSKLFRYFTLIEESPFGRFFYANDTSHISDVLKFEYDNARAARKNMAARKAMATKSS